MLALICIPILSADAGTEVYYRTGSQTIQPAVVEELAIRLSGSTRLSSGEAWNLTFEASGGAKGYVFQAPTLPSGIVASYPTPSSLRLSGTSASGAYAGILVSVRDGAGSSATAGGIVTVDAPLAIAQPSAASLSPASGSSWTISMPVTGGRPSATTGTEYTFSISPALPSGTTGSASGSSFSISGAGPAAKHGPFVVVATDSIGNAISSAPFSVTVEMACYATKGAACGDGTTYLGDFNPYLRIFTETTARSASGWGPASTSCQNSTTGGSGGWGLPGAGTAPFLSGFAPAGRYWLNNGSYTNTPADGSFGYFILPGTTWGGGMASGGTSYNVRCIKVVSK